MSWWRLFLWLVIGLLLIILDRGILAALPFPINTLSPVLFILIFSFILQLRAASYWLALVVAVGADFYSGTVGGVTSLTVLLILLVGEPISTGIFTHRSLGGSLLISEILTTIWVLARYFLTTVIWWWQTSGWSFGALNFLSEWLWQLAVMAVVVIILYRTIGRWLPDWSPVRIGGRLYD